MPLTQTQTSLPLSDSDLLVVKQWAFDAALGFLLLGVQVTLSIAVLCVFVAQNFPLSKSRLALSFVTIMMFFFSLSSLVMVIEDIIRQIPSNGYNPPDSGEIIALRTELEIGIDFMNRLSYVMGDMVVVWRAWVLFPQGLPAKVALSICLMGSFVGTSLDIGLLTKGLLENPSYSGNKTETMILIVPLIFTNFTATTLIGFKTWYHFRSIQRNLGSTNKSPSKVLKILWLLIESGLLYLALWIGYFVVALIQDSVTTANQAYHSIMPGLVAIYPILIILAVAHENSKPESMNDISLSQSIRFASIRASKSEAYHSESGGESQLAFSATDIANGAEVERHEIDIVPRQG
ncbi:hypothetical protein K435DRAFT_867052 [Dendrothele bispora CBS 962.96]|uniref:Family A G protein-coupled receptor-like protein n=1 Tax=Dendrothele bispora (strain CBS 962.96) TaxID=1314807 RepID=A0A4S8LG12_DENBC|nr:hypothetical protein K435DRAFT_867052 [Dendrothele bispora CBS 962.96]